MINKFFEAIHTVFAVVLTYVAMIDLYLLVRALERGDVIAIAYRGFATFFLGFAAGVSIRNVMRHRASERRP